MASNILGYDPEAVQQQQLWQGLLGLGSGLMQAGARTTDPGAAMKGFGNAVGMAQQGVQSAKAQAMQDLMQRYQMQKMADETSQANAKKEALARIYGGLDPKTGIQWNTPRHGLTEQDQLSLLAQAYPDQFAAMALKKMVPEYEIKGGRVFNKATGELVKDYGPETAFGWAVQPDGTLAPILGGPEDPKYKAGTAGLVAGSQAAATVPINIAGDIEKAARLLGINVEQARLIAENQGRVDIAKAGPMAGAAENAKLKAGAEPVTLPNGTVVPAGAAVDVGKEIGKEASKKVTAAGNIIPLIDDARSLLKQSTGSIVGKGVDFAAGIVGATTKGAEASARLKVLQGNLMLMQPRMEGPQSDRDTALYKDMAGQIGDATIPVGVRLAALDQIEALQLKYRPDLKKPTAVSKSTPNPVAGTFEGFE